MPERKVLHSWKDISKYAGRGIRTIQRYEVQLGFPIHRPAGKSRSSVLAFSDEVDAWLNKAPMVAVLPALMPPRGLTAEQISKRREWLAVAANAKRGLECAQTMAEACKLQAGRVRQMMERFEAARLKALKRPQLNRFA